jgi:hypothetical protein
MPRESCLDLRVLVRGVVIDHGFHQLAGRDDALDVVNEPAGANETPGFGR